ncbi:MAG: histidine phosphatase family protein [Phycisphaeraceae bacterium]
MDDSLHILLVRHGQTDANQFGIVQGHRPTSLNALGHRQAQLVARRLATFTPRIDLIISSDLPRAMETAAPIAAALKLDVRYDPAWRERCYGTFEGLNPQERVDLRQRLNLAAGALPPGAQTEAEYQAGICAALRRLPAVAAAAGQASPLRCILVVTHGGACRAIPMMLADGRLPAAPDNPVPGEFACPNAALTHLIYRASGRGHEYRYGCVYDVEHLEPATVTARDAG